MNLSLGLYDLFSYLVPGVLYIYILNEFLIMFNWASIDIAKLNNVIYLTVLIITAYVIGHLTSTISHYVWYGRIPNMGGLREKILRDFQSRSSEIEIRFKPRETGLILDILRRRDIEATENIDRHKANSLMLRNVAHALFIFALYHLLRTFKSGFTVEGFTLTILFVLLGIAAYLGGKRFNEWHYKSIFNHALSYGPGLKEFLENDKPCWKIPIEDPHRSEEDQ